MANERERQDEAREHAASDSPIPEGTEPEWESAEADVDAEPHGPDESPAEPTGANRAVEALRLERDDLFARLQHVSADYQNSMRRVDQKLADAVDFARGDLFKGLIPVLDHFDRALQGEPLSEDARSLVRGMDMVREELLKMLGQAGVERVVPEPGDPFDPYRHEAMLRQPAHGVEPNHIAAAFEPGYIYKGRTLRPAKVAVAPEE